MIYQTYTPRNYMQIAQLSKVSKEDLHNIDVVSRVLPFKTNNYVVSELIDWDNYQNDPMYILNFPQKGMLKPEHFTRIEKLILNEEDPSVIKSASEEIRKELNPHPAGQTHNIPVYMGEMMQGVQHKYNETLLFFPSQGQTCHAYCTFCFRWPQFVTTDSIKFAMKEIENIIGYIREHEEITDILITGGDPMVMKASVLDTYVSALLEADLPHLQNIRIGSKTLSFWPYRYLTDPDAEEILGVFRKITDAGKSLCFMAHFNHPRELETEAVIKAIKKIRETGAQIRTQSPLLKHINAKSGIWATMWKKQVQLGMIPYYMFIARDTGAQEYFGVSLDRAWDIFRRAYSSVSGVARTVRGPSMSSSPGKIRIAGVTDVNGEKVFVLEFIQGRNNDWVGRPFFARFNKNAYWLDDLEPAFGADSFFYEDELAELLLN